MNDMTDWFRYKGIVRKSRTTQKDVDELVRKIKKGRWEKTKAAMNDKG